MSILTSLLLALFTFGTVVPLAWSPEKYVFSYPNTDYAIALSLNIEGNVEKHWHGDDYFYSGLTKDTTIFFVLFFKLNAADQAELATLRERTPGTPVMTPLYPLSYFMSTAPLKQYETMTEIWGNPESGFMFRQAHVESVEGIKIDQKNMYAYTMPAKDIFVAIHISKVMCTPEDSTALRTLIESVHKP